MLVAISGSQGAGKSTVIQTLKAMGGCQIVDRKSSRSILKDWDVTLAEVNNNPELTVKFQREIIKRKYEDEQSVVNAHPGEIIITERTFNDLAIYNTFVLGHMNEYSDFVTAYYDQCMTYSQSYDLVFYLRAGHFTPENDGVRGTNVHYSRLIDLALEDSLKSNLLPDRLVIVDTPILQQRISTIDNMITAKFNQIYKGK